MDDLCRICLVGNNETDSIYTVKLVKNTPITISKMIAVCTGLEISKYDSLPNVICKICTEGIINAFEYRSKCWESHATLLSQAKAKYDENREVTAKSKDRTIITEFEIVQILELPEKSFEDQLETHVDTVTDKSCHFGKRYNCRLCSQSYALRYQMIVHLESAHQIRITIRNGHKCPTCHKEFETKKQLQSHVPRHSLNTHICHFCGLTLKNKKNLIEHTRIHTGEKPYKCEYCDFRASRLCGIKLHTRTHTGEKPVICHVCGKAFRTASHRNVHQRSHSNETPYECIMCHKKFKKSSSFKDHMITHDPTKFWTCKECGRKFSTRGSFRTHLKQHTGEKSYRCSVCGKGFIQRHCWRIHMVRHHNHTVQ